MLPGSRKHASSRAWMAPFAVSALVIALHSGFAQAQWSDNFDSYDAGTTLSGQGGWAGWDLSAVDADVTDEQSFSDPNSLKLHPDSDMVQVYTGFVGGIWRAHAMTYIPSDHTGQTWYILLNTYTHGGAKNWSTQVVFENGRVTSSGGSDFGGAGSLPWIADEWVSLDVEIDLEANAQVITYDGEVLDETPWQASGINEIQAIDLYSANGVAAFFDDISFTPVASGPRPVRTATVTGACPNPDPVSVTIQQPLAEGANPNEIVKVTETISGSFGAAQVVAANGGVVSDIFPTPLTSQGFITSWLLLGPYSQPGGAQPGDDAIRLDYLTDGGDTEFDVLPSAGDSISTDFGGLAASTGLAYSSATVNPDGIPTWSAWYDANDTINFDEYYGGNIDNIMMYAVAYLRVEADVDVSLCIGSDDAIQVLIDAEEVHINNAARGWGGTRECQDTVDLGIQGFGTLGAGEHTLMVKVFEGGGGHGFRLGLLDPVTLQPAEGISVCLEPGNAPCSFAPIGARIEWMVSRQQLVTGVGYTLDLNSGKAAFKGDVAGVRTLGDRSVLVCPLGTDAQGFITGSHFLGLGPFSHRYTCGVGQENLLLGNHIANASIRTEYPALGDTIDYDADAAASTAYLGPTSLDGKPVWRTIDDGTEDGIQDLNIGLGNLDGVMGWLVTYVEYKGAGPIDINLCFGSDDGGQLWWDCDLIANTRACQGVAACNVGTFPVTVEPGVHRIAAGAWDNTGGWGLSLRMLEADAITPIVDGDPSWSFPGAKRPEGFTPPECQGCAPEAVKNLTCVSGKCGLIAGVVLNWENPANIDNTVPTRIEVNGVLVATVASDATTACVNNALLPDGVYEIAVIHCGGVPAICSPFKTNELGQIRSTAWLIVGPFLNNNDGCDGTKDLTLNQIAPTEISCFNPVEGDEMPFDLEDPDQASLAYNGPTGPNDDPLVVRLDDGLNDGDLNLDAHYGDQSNVMSWLVTYVRYLGDPGQITVCMGSDDSGQVWLNDTMVISDPACRPFGDCDAQATVDVEPGVYRIAFGIWENGGGWGGRLSLKNAETGEPIVDDGTSDWEFLGTERPPAEEFPGGVVPSCGGPTQPTFHRGDADDNGQLQLTDAVRILGFLFLGGPPPSCFDAADADDNGQLQLTDAVRVLGFLFLGGPPPAAPGRPGDACGADPTTTDTLDCASYTKC